MKKIFLAAVVALFAINANAQFWAGGALGFESINKNKDADMKESKFNFTPEFGYNFADNMGVGIKLGINNRKEVTGNVDIKTTTYCIAPYFRYVFLSFGNVSLFADAGIDLDIVKDGDNTFYAGVKPGIAIQCNEKITLATRLGSIGYSNVGDGIFTAQAGAYIGEIGIYYNF